jgi:hypothetical protein
MMHGVVAQIMPTVKDPLRDLRVSPEPGPDGETVTRAPARSAWKQRVSRRNGSLTVESERHLGPVP